MTNPKPAHDPGVARGPMARGRFLLIRLGWLVAAAAILAGGSTGFATQGHHHPPPEDQRCPRSHGYWKTHPEAWTRHSLVLGNPANSAHTYIKSKLLTLLHASSHGDASLILAHQLIAARLNVASGSNPAPVAAALTYADSLLGAFPGKLPYRVKTYSHTGKAMVATASVLERYNTGRLPHSCGTQNSPPKAKAGPDRTVFVGTIVQLDGSGSTDVDGDLLTFRWSLVSIPAGSAATLSDPSAVRPTFLVDHPGTYVVQLVVSDARSQSAPDTVQIDTKNSRPVANAGPNQTVLVGDLVQLDGSASSDVDGDPLTFRWQLASTPAGSHAALTDATAPGPAFIADLPGRYAVELVVNDGALDSVADTVEIDTANSRPRAAAGPDQTTTAGDLVQLDGRASSDVDGDPLSFRWSFTTRPDGSAASLSDATAAQPTFVPDVAGLYVVQLVVNDGTVDGEPDTVAIEAESAGNTPPVADAGPDQTVDTGATVRLDGSRSADPQGTPLAFFWSLVSRPAGSVAALSNATLVTPTFVADRPGVYVAELTVGDGVLLSAPDTVMVTAQVGADLGIAFVDPPTTPAVGAAVTLSVDVTNGGPASATAVTARFRVPPGYTLTGAAPQQGSYEGATGDWAIGALPVDSQTRLVLSAVVNATGPYDLTATIIGSAPADPSVANNTATATVTPNPNADLAHRAHRPAGHPGRGVDGVTRRRGHQRRPGQHDGRDGPVCCAGRLRRGRGRARARQLRRRDGRLDHRVAPVGRRGAARPLGDRHPDRRPTS